MIENEIIYEIKEEARLSRIVWWLKKWPYAVTILLILAGVSWYKDIQHNRAIAVYERNTTKILHALEKGETEFPPLDNPRGNQSLNQLTELKQLFKQYQTTHDRKLLLNNEVLNKYYAPLLYEVLICDCFYKEEYDLTMGYELQFEPITQRQDKRIQLVLSLLKGMR